MPFDTSVDPSIITGGLHPSVPLYSPSEAASLAGIYQQRQLNAQRMQENQLTIEAKKRAIADDQLYGNTVAANTVIGPDGAPVVNHPAIIQAFAKAGKGHLLNQYTASMIAQRKEELEEAGKQFDLDRKSTRL